MGDLLQPCYSNATLLLQKPLLHLISTLAIIQV